jgi:hypothetical protein
MTGCAMRRPYRPPRMTAQHGQTYDAMKLARLLIASDTPLAY